MRKYEGKYINKNYEVVLRRRLGANTIQVILGIKIGTLSTVV